MIVGCQSIHHGWTESSPRKYPRRLLSFLSLPLRLLLSFLSPSAPPPLLFMRGGVSSSLAPAVASQPPPPPSSSTLAEKEGEERREKGRGKMRGRCGGLREMVTGRRRPALARSGAALWLAAAQSIPESGAVRSSRLGHDAREAAPRLHLYACGGDLGRGSRRRDRTPLSLTTRPVREGFNSS